MGDFRIIAVLLAVFGALLGLCAGLLVLLWSTGVILVAAFTIIIFAASRLSFACRTSFGIMIVAAGAVVCLLAPAWMIHWLACQKF